MTGVGLMHCGDPLAISVRRHPYLAPFDFGKTGRVLTVPLDEWRAEWDIRTGEVPSRRFSGGNGKNRAILQARGDRGNWKTFPLGEAARLHISLWGHLNIIAWTGEEALSLCRVKGGIVAEGSQLRFSPVRGPAPDLLISFRLYLTRFFHIISLPNKGMSALEARERGDGDPKSVVRVCPNCLTVLRFSEAKKSGRGKGENKLEELWLDPRIRFLCCKCYSKAEGGDLTGGVRLHPLLL